MRLSKIYITLTAVLIILLIVFIEPSMAQPAPPSDVDQAPIDGGLALLAAAGGAYGLKKIREKRSE